MPCPAQSSVRLSLTEQVDDLYANMAYAAYKKTHDVGVGLARAFYEGHTPFGRFAEKTTLSPPRAQFRCSQSHHVRRDRCITTVPLSAIFSQVHREMMPAYLAFVVGKDANSGERDGRAGCS